MAWGFGFVVLILDQELRRKIKCQQNRVLRQSLANGYDSTHLNDASGSAGRVDCRRWR